MTWDDKNMNRENEREENEQIYTPIDAHISIYMSCRSYTSCRSLTSAKFIAEVKLRQTILSKLNFDNKNLSKLQLRQ